MKKTFLIVLTLLFSVGLSADATTVAVGAPLSDASGQDSGQVRVYDLSGLLASEAEMASNFSILPNPAKNRIRLQFAKGLVVKAIHVYSLSGRLIGTYKNTIIDISDLSSGVYLIEVVSDTSRQTEKLIVE